MATTRHHDQNFKNLILDYPQEAIAFFAPAESQHTAEPDVRIVPVREEQLKENLRNSHRELDTPFIDIYAALDENELTEYQRQYPEETAIMGSFSQRFIEQGIEQGEAKVLSRQVELKFGPEAVAAHRDELAQADADTLLRWSERVLTAKSPDEVFTH